MENFPTLHLHDINCIVLQKQNNPQIKKYNSSEETIPKVQEYALHSTHILKVERHIQAESLQSLFSLSSLYVLNWTRLTESPYLCGAFQTCAPSGLLQTARLLLLSSPKPLPSRCTSPRCSEGRATAFHGWRAHCPGARIRSTSKPWGCTTNMTRTCTVLQSPRPDNRRLQGCVTGEGTEVRKASTQALSFLTVYPRFQKLQLRAAF